MAEEPEAAVEPPRKRRKKAQRAIELDSPLLESSSIPASTPTRSSQEVEQTPLDFERETAETIEEE